VEHCEEDGEAVAVEAEEVLVEEEDADVGEVPGGNDEGGDHRRREASAVGSEAVTVLPRRRGRNVEDLVRTVEARIAHSARGPCLRLHHRRQQGLLSEMLRFCLVWFERRDLSEAE